MAPEFGILILNAWEQHFQATDKTEANKVRAHTRGAHRISLRQSDKDPERSPVIVWSGIVPFSLQHCRGTLPILPNKLDLIGQTKLRES